MSRSGRRRRLERRRQHERHEALETGLRESGTDPLAAYWEARYATGGDSGAGSRGEPAQMKAEYVNDLIRREDIRSVVDWGCGDGQQLARLDVGHYLGVDISPSAVARSMRRHPDRAFLVWPGDQPEVTIEADLALSLDVIFHLVDDTDFASYWTRLFGSARRFVCVFATDVDDSTGARHVRHRRHSHLAPEGWELVDRADDPAVAGFYLWGRP